jgi:aquaporin Z
VCGKIKGGIFMNSMKKYIAEFIGTSVNPARSLGSAVFAGGEALANVWVFFVGPLVGGVLAALVYKFLTKEEK